MGYRNLLFDLGNVLLFFDPDKALKELATHLKPLTALLLWAKKDEFLKELRGEADLLETGRMTIEQFYSRLKGKIGLELELDQFVRIWNDIFTANQAMLDLATELSGRYACYIASNTNEAHFRHVLAEFPALGFAKRAALSYELGELKPSREFFRKALAKFGIAADESVFVDDIELNVEGARQAGIQAIRSVDAGQVRAALEALGVK